MAKLLIAFRKVFPANEFILSVISAKGEKEENDRFERDLYKEFRFSKLPVRLIGIKCGNLISKNDRNPSLMNYF